MANRKRHEISRTQKYKGGVTRASDAESLRKKGRKNAPPATRATLEVHHFFPEVSSISELQTSPKS